MSALNYPNTNVLKREAEITTLFDNEMSNSVSNNNWVEEYGYSSTALPNPYSGHFGIDFRASSGTKVYPMGETTITETGNTENDGNFIRYEWNGFRVTYRHLSKFLKTKGDKVSKDEVIAETGNTGLSSGAHLHVDLLGLSSGKWHDPYDYLTENDVETDGGDTSGGSSSSSEGKITAVRSGKNDDNGTFYFDLDDADKFDFGDKILNETAYDLDGSKWLPETTWTSLTKDGSSSSSSYTKIKAVRSGKKSDNGTFYFDISKSSDFDFSGKILKNNTYDLDGDLWIEKTTWTSLKKM